jgi:hypothetical protein
MSNKFSDAAETTYYFAVDMIVNHIPEVWGDKAVRKGVHIAAGVLAVGATIAGLMYGTRGE